jgi:hypothetical protein
MTDKDRELLHIAIANIRMVQRRMYAGWRWDLCRIAIKLLTLARQERLTPPGHNPHTTKQLRELLTTEWLYNDDRP